MSDRTAEAGTADAGFADAPPARQGRRGMVSADKGGPVAAQAGAPRALTRRAGGPQRAGARRRREARFQRRHWLVLLSFLAIVVGPSGYANWYLHERAADQFASQLAFTIQSEDGPTLSSLGSLFAGSGATGGADDAEVLYGFIQSQNLVQTLQDQIDLRTMFNKAAPEDWWFSLGDDPSIEALADYWKWMVRVAFNAGIVEVEARAFTPEDAQTIARAVLAESTKLINRLSEERREDAVRDARLSLEEATSNLRETRLRLAELRAVDQRVDPTLDLQAMMRRIGELEASLTDERLRLDQLNQFARPGDSRVQAAERRIRALEDAVAQERARLSGEDEGAGALSASISKFEELTVDRELAERAYAAALASYEAAKTSARRQHRYLSAHVAPTLAQTPQYPERYTLGALVTLFLFMGWVVLVMVAYNIKDRR